MKKDGYLEYDTFLLLFLSHVFLFVAGSLDLNVL